MDDLFKDATILSGNLKVGEATRFAMGTKTSRRPAEKAIVARGGDAATWPARQQVEELTLMLSASVNMAKSQDLATLLLEEFGSLPATLAASIYRLGRIPGMTKKSVQALKQFETITEKLAMERIAKSKPIMASWNAVLDYLNCKMANLSIEQFRILFLDKKNRLISDEVQQTGTVDHAPVFPREVIRRALELSATALIIVHNHPSGDPHPSAADVRMTREIKTLSEALGIALHDHIIVGASGHASLRKLSLL